MNLVLSRAVCAFVMCAMPALAFNGEITVPIVATDTFGNPVKHYRVEINSEERPQAVYQSPTRVVLPIGLVRMRISASLHRGVTQDLEVVPTLQVIRAGLARPTGSQISGEDSQANPTVQVSVGPVDASRLPLIARVVSIYSSYTREALISSRDGEVTIDDLPFGEYRLFVYVKGKVSQEFELINAEFKPTMFKALRP